MDAQITLWEEEFERGMMQKSNIAAVDAQTKLNKEDV